MVVNGTTGNTEDTITLERDCIEKPQFKHDCNSCIFLGIFNGEDLYFCNNEPTVISRRSSEGPDYRSGLNYYGIKNWATKAGNLVLERKLITPERFNQFTSYYLGWSKYDTKTWMRLLKNDFFDLTFEFLKDFGQNSLRSNVHFPDSPHDLANFRR